MHSAYSMLRLIPMLLASSLFLAACNDKPPASTTTAVASTASSLAPAASPAGEEMNEALSTEKVNATLSLEGQPSYLEDEDVLLFHIKVVNHGQTDLVGAGTKPVLLGALLLGPEGPDKAPGLRDFVNVRLPLITKGKEQTVQIKLPAESLKGQTIQFQLLQGGVSWFDGFGQAPLNLGAYSRCNSAAKMLCDSAGTPVNK